MDLPQVQERGALAFLSSGFAPVLRSKFIRSVTALSGASVLGQALNVAMAPVLTRLYLPGNLGEFALFASFINVVVVVVSLRYEFAIISADDECEAAQLTLCSLLFALPTSALGVLTFYGLIKHGLLGYGTMPFYAALLVFPALLFTAAFTALRYWCLRQERFGTILRATIFQNVSRALSQAGLGLFGPHTSGLLVGEVMGRCSGTDRMLRAAWPVLKAEFAVCNIQRLKKVLSKNRQFAIYSVPSSLLDALAASISLPLVVTLYGLTHGGNYALVARVLALPSVLITASVADVFHSKAALTLREGKDRTALLALVKRTAGILLLIGLGPTIILTILGPRLFEIVFGRAWAEAGMIAAWVSPWFLAQFVVSPLSRVVLVVGGQRSKFIYDVIALGGTIAVFALAHYSGWPLMRTIITLTAVKTAAYAVFYSILLKLASGEFYTTSARVPAET